MEKLVTVLPGAPEGWLSEPDRTGPPGNQARFTRGAINQRLRQSYGIYKLIGAPRQALRLGTALAGTALARHVATHGPISALAAQPFVCSKWSTGLRLRRMVEHCAIIDQLGHPFDVTGAQYVEIIAFELGDSRCRLILDKPKWLGCDGLLCASLWVESDRVFTVSFCLSDDGFGRTVYVGGIQGKRDSGALDQNRALTKAAHGMRPRDLAFDLFRMLLPRLGVSRMACVADAFRYQMTRRATLTIGANDRVQLDYDETWTSRGGVPGKDGFFLVPVERQCREMADIPAKKRSLYARRYALLDQLNAAVATALDSDLEVKLHACG